jgi:hypothetical protein
VSKSVPPAIGPGMAHRRIFIRSKDVVLAKGIVEALEGVASVFAEHGGELVLASPLDREDELDALATDLARELEGVVEESGAPTRSQRTT